MPNKIDVPELIVVNFYTCERECVQVQITGEEYALCDKTSSNYWSNNKPGAYGKGLGSTYDDKYKPVRTGLLGQMAFSKLFGLPVDTKYRKYGDKYDNLLKGKKVDVKCAMRNYGKGLIYHTNEWGRRIPLDKDIYVFSFIKDEDRPNNNATIVIVGYAEKDEISSIPPSLGMKGNGHLNYEVPFADLRSILELKEIYDN